MVLCEVFRMLCILVHHGLTQNRCEHDSLIKGIYVHSFCPVCSQRVLRLETFGSYHPEIYYNQHPGSIGWAHADSTLLGYNAQMQPMDMKDHYTTPFYIKNSSIQRLWYLWRGPGTCPS